ncbi:MAG: hypothetical protein KatS3mg111_2011 [Pirellulaceae bacterium]|nr:MAG: hypothetical protein KatS3mg111_2011 [Pirellulaceae bacterium]
MQKVKLFKGLESELTTLEQEINEWIEQSQARVISITGNIAPQTRSQSSMGSFGASDVLIIVHYEDGRGS